MPTFIINFNMKTWPEAMLPHIRRMGGRPIIIDNHSTAPETLAWYETRPCEVIQLAENYGHRAPWVTGIVQQYCPNYYAVTDPDLDLAGVPDEALQHLRNGLDRFPFITKCGLSLEINDLPDESIVKTKALAWESPFWLKRFDWQFWDAPIDTTLAVYDGRRGYHPDRFLTAARADRPFTFRHLPFYLTEANMTEELFNYFTAALGESATLATHLEPMLRQWKERQKK
jgi:hypothetical protein